MRIFSVKTRSEQGQDTEAERLLRTALSLNPNLQIKEEFEHPSSSGYLRALVAHS